VRTPKIKTAVPDLTHEQIQTLRIRGYQDPVWFCRYFLNHIFPDPIPWVHRGLLAILTGRCGFLPRYGELDKICSNFVYSPPDDPEATRHIFRIERKGKPRLKMDLGRYTLVMMPRGFAKTTIAGVAVPIMETLYQDIKVGVYVSEAGPHARMQLNNVKRELSENFRIISIFGKLKPELSDSKKWTEEFFETKTGVAWGARGRGSQIRGFNHQGHRPDKIICDDLEDKESVATEAQREKTREWTYGDLLPALPEMNPNATIVMLGTLLHPEALLETLAQDPLWTVVRFGCTDAQNDLLWPQNMSAEKLRIRKESYARAGQLHVFYMEYFNESRAPETQKFRKEYFHYGPVPADPVPVATSIYCDPAISKRDTADDSVIAVCSMCADGRIFLREAWGGRGISPRELVDKYFELAILYKCTHHGVESNAYQAALVHLLREEMFRKHHYFEVEPVTHSSRKSERILGILQPRFANGYIWFTQHFRKMETQLLDYHPEADLHDDYPDALAGAIALLDPHAALAADQDPTADIYEPLESDFGQWAS